MKHDETPKISSRDEIHEIFTVGAGDSCNFLVRC